MHFTRRGGLARRVAISVAAAVVFTAVVGTAAQAAPMRFGVDSDQVAAARARGLNVAYGTLWIGAWTQRYGWNTPQRELAAAAASNTTPVINWWYWGDDISPSCVEQGCTDARQGVRKDKATWYRMTDELGRLIAQTMGDRETIVIVETEFNKGGIETYEPFDGYLAEQAAILHRYGNIKVVVGFGNWGRSNWARFDRAIAASDLLGMQLMRSSIREAANYGDAVNTIVTSARYLQTAFNKPSIVTDLALSSYPSASYEGIQAQVMSELFARMVEIKAAGVQAILYRALVDNPTFDTSNYHGEAERYWGLLRADGSAKPVFAVFAAGLRNEEVSGSSSGPAACDAPGAPANFVFSLQGSAVTLMWGSPTAGPMPTSYVIEAGTGPALANIAAVPVAATLARVNAPAGVYFVRIRSRNTCGISGASNEQIIRVG